jgi:hypothetical protein
VPERGLHQVLCVAELLPSFPVPEAARRQVIAALVNDPPAGTPNQNASPERQRLAN